MKNLVKVIGLIALIAVIGSMVACKKGGGGKASPTSDFSYDLTADGRGIKITGYTGKGGAVVIPSKIEDLPVLEIGMSAFQGANTQQGQEPKPSDRITSIIVPDSVEVIGMYAFALMDELNKITLSNGIKEIPNSAIASNLKLKSVNLPTSIVEVYPSI